VAAARCFASQPPLANVRLSSVPQLQRLRADHAPAVLDFEVANRAYFAATIGDRGDEFFEQFPERFRAWLVNQQTGVAVYHVLVDEDGSILGRFNLTMVGDRSAELGYRVAQRAAGQGVATATVREVCRLASTSYGLDRIRAATSLQNVASQKVLIKTGFIVTGPADPADLGGQPGRWYELVVAAG
jgi:ribosomal-protein-alanine N-acetyltransferase